MIEIVNVTRSLERNSRRSPDQVALISGDQRLTHAELDEHVRALSDGLRSLELRPGDVVAMLMGNSIEFIECAFAINAIGAVYLPLNTRLAVAEWEYILQHSDARALVVDEALGVDVAALTGKCANLATVIGIGDAGNGTATLGKLRAANAGSKAAYEDVTEATISRLMYTSGTTARPKGVPLSYGNIWWKTFGHLVEFGLTASDRTLMAGPMFHVGAFDLPGIGTLLAGGSIVVLPRFDPSHVLETIARERVTNVWLAPAMLNAILQLGNLSHYDTSTVRFVTNGGEKMPASLIERFFEAFPNAWLADSFGMTETVSGDTFLDAENTLTKLGSVGRPILHCDVKIVREDDSEAAVDEPGELLLRGPKVFSGYWKDSEATEAAFVDGWFRTGDIAHLDSDGYLFIDDRKKDMIVSGGENIASPEIERVLYSHPAVLEAAVVGTPDERWGEVPRAVVVLRPDCQASEAELIELCRGQLAKYKVPRSVEFVEALPRTSTGKIMKRALRQTASQ